MGTTFATGEEKKSAAIEGDFQIPLPFLDTSLTEIPAFTLITMYIYIILYTIPSSIPSLDAIRL